MPGGGSKNFESSLVLRLQGEHMSEVLKTKEVETLATIIENVEKVEEKEQLATYIDELGDEEEA